MFDAIFPTAECGVDGILVLELCDAVVVFDAILSTAACGVDGVLVLEFCDVAVVFDLAVAINIGFTDHLITAYWLLMPILSTPFSASNDHTLYDLPAASCK